MTDRESVEQYIIDDLKTLNATGLTKIYKFIRRTLMTDTACIKDPQEIYDSSCPSSPYESLAEKYNNVKFKSCKPNQEGEND